jgi:hypothetical protein
MKTHEISWEKCTDVCSNGTNLQIKNLAHTRTSSQCVLHRHTPVVKNICHTIKNMLDEAVHIVNYIKTRPLQPTVFKIVCEDIGSQHSCACTYRSGVAIMRKTACRLFELH